MQPWSNGKVGLNGISYYGMNQWHVAALRPAAPGGDVRMGGRVGLVPRLHPPRRHPLHVLDQLVRHAGQDRPVRPRRARAASTRNTGALVCGDETLDEAELARNRVEFGDEILAHPLDDDYHRARSPAGTQSPCRSCPPRNWGGQGLHPRGNFEGFVRAADAGQVARGARHRALDALLHRLRRGAPEALLRPLPEGRGQRLGEPAAASSCRSATSTRFVERARERVAARAHAVDELYLDAATAASTARAAGRRGQVAFEALGDGVTFMSAPLETRDRDHRPARRAAVRFLVDRPTPISSSSFRVFTPDLREVTFHGRHRSAYAGRPGLAARLAPQARPEARDAVPALPHARREAAAASPARSCSSMSRSGRRRSSFRRATASRSPSAAATTSGRSRPAPGSRTSRTSCSAAGPSCTTIPRPPRRSSAGRPPSTPTTAGGRGCCCRSYRRDDQRRPAGHGRHGLGHGALRRRGRPRGRGLERAAGRRRAARAGRDRRAPDRRGGRGERRPRRHHGPGRQRGRDVRRGARRVPGCDGVRRDLGAVQHRRRRRGRRRSGPGGARAGRRRAARRGGCRSPPAGGRRRSRRRTGSGARPSGSTPTRGTRSAPARRTARSARTGRCRRASAPPVRAPCGRRHRADPHQLGLDARVREETRRSFGVEAELVGGLLGGEDPARSRRRSARPSSRR